MKLKVKIDKMRKVQFENLYENIVNSDALQSLRHIDSSSKSSTIEELDFNLDDCLVDNDSLLSLQGQEKWSSVRICDSKKNSVKVENHVSTHSNLNLNGLHQKEVKEVKLKIYNV